MNRATIRQLNILCFVLTATQFAVAGGARAETLLQRGTYLMQSIVACGNCHTPKTDKGVDLPGMELAGGLPIVEPHLSVLSPNITPDKETGIGKWTEAQIVDAIRNGKRPDGSLIGAPMPVKDFYQKISDRDVKAIAAYLRSVKAVKNKVPRNTYNFPLPKSYGSAVGKVATVGKRNKLKYGAYLAGPLGHCTYCHSPLNEKTMNVDVGAHLGAGGLAFVFPFGTVQSANITSDVATGLGKWSDAEIKAAITQGKSRDGSPLFPPMPIPYYAKIAPADLDAIVAYVRSLPAKPAVRTARMAPAAPAAPPKQ